MSALVKASHLHRYYLDTHAVDDVSIELQQGDILGLLGPNGAGKSSCMQMISGTLAPSAGDISICGYNLVEQPHQAKLHIGYLPDRPPVYNELKVDEYLDYCARLRRISRTKIRAMRELAKQRCGLETFGQRLIANLSKGYQQRVGIAQAIIHQPDVIILDEPTVGLDPLQMREIRKLIQSLGEQHGVILSTHILPEVQAVCNRVQVIHQGRSVYNSSIEQLENNHQLRLRLEKPISLENIQQLPGVSRASQPEDGVYLLEGENIYTSATDISQYCVEQQLGLLEMSRASNTLEQVFIQLTTSDQTDEETVT